MGVSKRSYAILLVLLLLSLAVATVALCRRGLLVPHQAQAPAATIPSIVHFVFALAPQSVPFSFVHYVAVLSAHLINRPAVILLHYHFPIYGPWFERLQEDVPQLHHMWTELPTVVGNKALKKTAHRADVVRLQALLEFGGTYLDIDTICVRPFGTLLEATTTVLAREGRALCNAVMLAPVNAEFLRIWRDAYAAAFNPEGWNEASVQLPARLAVRHPDSVTVLPESTFFLPSWTEVHKIFVDVTPQIPTELVTLHLWESCSQAHMRNIEGWGWAEENPHTLYGLLLKNVLRYLRPKGNTTNPF